MAKRTEAEVLRYNMVREHAKAKLAKWMSKPGAMIAGIDLEELLTSFALDEIRTDNRLRTQAEFGSINPENVANTVGQRMENFKPCGNPSCFACKVGVMLKGLFDKGLTVPPPAPKAETDAKPHVPGQGHDEFPSPHAGKAPEPTPEEMLGKAPEAAQEAQPTKAAVKAAIESWSTSYGAMDRARALWEGLADVPNSDKTRETWTGAVANAIDEAVRDALGTLAEVK